MTPKLKNFGDRLKYARGIKGFTNKELARRISQCDFLDDQGISRTAIIQLESGTSRMIMGNNLLKAAFVLEVNPYWLMFGVGNVNDLSDIADSVKISHSNFKKDVAYFVDNIDVFVKKLKEHTHTAEKADD